MGCHNLSAVLGVYPENMTMLYLGNNPAQPGVPYPQCILHSFNGNFMIRKNSGNWFYILLTVFSSGLAEMFSAVWHFSGAQ